LANVSLKLLDGDCIKNKRITFKHLRCFVENISNA
jgi:hypothetical protein